MVNVSEGADPSFGKWREESRQELPLQRGKKLGEGTEEFTGGFAGDALQMVNEVNSRCWQATRAIL